MVIIAAVDRSDRAPDVTQQAEALAEAFDDTIHVVHVLTELKFVQLERTNLDRTGEVLDMDEVRSVAAEIAEEAASQLTVSAQSVGLVGDPADQIVEYASEHDARYIVVSGRKRSPAGKAIFGSVAQSTLLNATCPVVISIRK